MKNIGDWICEKHNKVTGYPLTKEVLVAYIWLFMLFFIAACFTGGR